LLSGIALSADGGKTPSPDTQFSPRQLHASFVQLYNIPPEACLSILADLGYNVGAPEGKVTYNDLPLIFSLPNTSHDSIVGNTDTLNKETDSSPQNRIVILYHDSQRRDYGEIRHLLEQRIDVVASQILIEAMLLELSEDARRELGVEYKWSSGTATGDETEGGFEEDTSGDSRLMFKMARDWGSVLGDPHKFWASLNALIRNDEVEILSSPSVLTLNDRQARIGITEDVPIIETTKFTDTETKLSVRFEETGITLNIKPRVDKRNDWVTLQIQTEVSSAPRKDYIEIDGEPVAPVINRRKVETIARIRNNTPFIVGGLIRNERTKTIDRVPFLSRIPLLGYLFKTHSNRDEKREVIIVITPKVVEHHGENRPMLPKDSERFDAFDNRLFRNSYRIKAEDVFDLGFILDRPRVRATLRRARERVIADPSLMREPPFDEVRQNSIPGEEPIVVRMLYEIVKKLDLHEMVSLDRLIYFARDVTEPAGFDVTFLKNVLEEKWAGGEPLMNYLKKDYPKRVLFLKYALGERSEDETATTPVADIEIRMVGSRDEAKEILYEFGRLKGFHRTHTAILIADTDDIERLKASIALRETLKVNDVERIQRMENFKLGREIIIPELDPSGERIFLIDDKTADLFFESDFYYEVFQDKFVKYYRALQEYFTEMEGGEEELEESLEE
jgi:Flp pilus assembly secretin CpaC